MLGLDSLGLKENAISIVVWCEEKLERVITRTGSNFLFVERSPTMRRSGVGWLK